MFSKKLELMLIVLTLIGLSISVYLAWVYGTPGASLACGSSNGCDAVKNSEYSSLFGVSVPIWGIIFYLTLPILLIVQMQMSTGKWLPYIALAIFGLTLSGLLFSAYLTYLELFVIYAICRWCVASAIIATLLFLLSIPNLNHNNALYER